MVELFRDDYILSKPSSGWSKSPKYFQNVLNLWNKLLPNTVRIYLNDVKDANIKTIRDQRFFIQGCYHDILDKHYNYFELMERWHEGNDLNTFQSHTSPFMNIKSIKTEMKQLFFKQLYKKKMYISKEPYDYNAPDNNDENTLQEYNHSIIPYGYTVFSFDEKYIKWIDEDIKNTFDKYF